MNARRIYATLFLLIFILGSLPNVQAQAQTSQAGGESTTLGAVQQSKLTSVNPSGGDKFGWSVAISGDFAVVGAPNEDLYWGSGTLRDAGAAYVYQRQGGDCRLYPDLLG